jgi:hypothetical protein
MLMLEQMTLLILAGKGLDILRQEWGCSRPRRIFRAGAIASLCLLAILDRGFRFAPVTVPLSAIFPNQEFYAPLKREALHGRVAAIGRTAIPYGAAGYLGVDMANGYEPLNLKHFEDYFSVIKYGDPSRLPAKPISWTDLEVIAKPEMLRALDVEYLVANASLPLEKIGFERIGGFGDVSVFSFYKGMVRAPVRIWRDMRPLGAAYFATSVTKVADAARSLASLTMAASVRDAYVLDLDRSADPLDFSGGTARMTKRGYDDYSYEIVSRGENFLILSQVWYPGWRAFIDGPETRLYRTNHALLGCFISPGAHTLRLSMTSPKLRTGLLLFAFGVLAIGALLWGPLKSIALWPAL